MDGATVLVMLRILVAVALTLALIIPASAEAPTCHPLGKGLSSVDMDGNTLTECWPLVIVAGLASD